MTEPTRHAPDDAIHVLHVDDDPSLADLTAQFLERADERVAVRTANSAEAGLDVLSADRVDCVVSDYDMPGMDGLEFLDAVRRDHPDLPFVLFTGKGSEEVASDAISAGVTDYLQKESGTDQYTVLANRVANAVEKRRMERRFEESERRFRELAELSPDGLFRLDPSGRYTYVSPAAEEQLGASADELLGTSFHPNLAESSLSVAQEGFARVLDGEVVRALELELDPRDGDHRVIEVSASPVTEDGEVVAVQGLSRDVTERKRRERERERAEERYRVLVDNFPDGGVFLYDEDLRYVLAGGAELAEVGLTADEMTGKSPSDLFPPAIAEELEAAYCAALDGEARTFEQSYQGEHYTIETSPLADEPELGLALSRNVTRRREREQKLDGLRERSRALMHTRTKAETMQVAVEAADEVIGAPLSGANLLTDDGETLEPVAMMGPVADAFDAPPSYHRDRPDGTRDAFVWGVFERGTAMRVDDAGAVEELTEETPAGSVLLYPVGGHGVFIVSSPDPDAWDETDVALAEILATTLTAAMDRVEREQRLRDRERRLGRLHEATRELVSAETRADIARGVVSAAEDILGFSIVQVRFYDEDAGGLIPVAASDPVERELGDRGVFGPDGDSLNWDAFAAGETRRYDDIDDVEAAADADTPLRSLMVLPLGDRGSLSIGETVPDAFDETDDFLARILATAAETALEATDREAELRAQHAELQRKNERLEEFASIVSHDLRNPLMVARGNLELAREDADVATDALAETEAALDRMDGLITDLLSMARTGEGLADLETVDLSDVVTEAWRYAGADGATLAVETDGTIRADRDRLQQLLENLLANSVEHGATAADGSVAVTVGSLPDGFYVADDGPGIPAEEREAVFETGYSTSVEGTGFGLGIVAEIVESHGWDVRVSESEAGGARFEVTGVERP